MILRSGMWYIVNDEQPCFPAQFGFKKLAKSFRLTIQQLLRDCNVTASTATVRPSSKWISCHVGSISMPCSLLSFCNVESWLQLQLRHPATGQGKALNQLPLVT